MFLSTQPQNKGYGDDWCTLYIEYWLLILYDTLMAQLFSPTQISCACALEASEN